MMDPEKIQGDGKNLKEQLEVFVNWLIESKLFDKFGTCKTDSKVIEL